MNVEIKECPVCDGKKYVCIGIKDNLEPILKPCTGCDGTGRKTMVKPNKEEIMDKLNRKLLGWAGFKCEREEYIDNTQDPPMLYEAAWSAPPSDSKYTFLPVYAPGFPNSFDACFGWLVPKGNITDISFMLDTGGTSQLPSCTIGTFRGSYTGYHEDIKVAFCLAVEKLIDSSV